MADSQLIDPSDNHDMDIDHLEGVIQSDGLDSQNDHFDGLDGFDHQSDVSHISAPSSTEDQSMETLMSLNDIELEDGRTALTFKKFGELPEELQMSVWKFAALHVRRTIMMSFGRDSFTFVNCPPTPAIMHACHQARKYGLDIYKPVDVHGIPRDIEILPGYENYITCVAFYFYVNPVSDDFVLKFGDETVRPNPVYCPIESKCPNRLGWVAAEQSLEERIQALERERRQIRNIPNRPPRPGESVFPTPDILPQFFTNIRSVGINLNLPFAEDFSFSNMSPEVLRSWARNAIKTTFDHLFTQILEQFPKLEYAFAVVRAIGRSNQELNERFELGKENWGTVGMTNAEGVIMGKEEFQQLEFEGRRWFMERIDGGGGLNVVDFDLYVQRNLYWEI